MAGMLAFCGLDCAECPAYIATQANDVAAQERLLADWRVQFNAPDMPMVAVICDGCTSLQGRHGGYCMDCPVRACADEQSVASCAHCADYGCEKLEAFLSQGPELRERLEAIRRSLAM